MAASVRELAEQASFIFEGTVRRNGAVSSSTLEPTGEMAVVHVHRIIKGPPVLAKFAGQDVTVELSRPGTPDHERALTFFTTGLHFADGLAVRELGRVESPGREIEAEVHEAEREIVDRALLERLRSAETVAAGSAIRTGPYQPQGDTQQRLVSEHDPDWWECVIRVRDMLKGRAELSGRRSPAAREIVTLFAHSTDIVWYQSPKFSEGQEGIWLLHRTDFRGHAVPAPVSDHPLDFQPLTELDRIRDLLERSRR